MLIESHRHRLSVGSVTTDGIAAIMGQERAALVYTDPPWGPGNLKYWRTKNGESIRPSWLEFVRCLVRIVGDYCDGWAFVEMGCRWADEVAAEFTAAGWSERHRHVMTYGAPPRPNVLLAFHRIGSWPSLDLPSGDGWNVTALIAERFSIADGILLDPCLGLGKSAAMFAAQGMRVHGLELNPRRLQQAWARLAKC